MLLLLTKVELSCIIQIYKKQSVRKIARNLVTKINRHWKGKMTMIKYECEGYIYDPAVGDPDAGIDPETAFEDIPDDWTCPICGLGKDVFVPVED